MRRVHQLLGLPGLLVMGLVSTHAFAAEPNDDVDPDAPQTAAQPKEAAPAAPAAAAPPEAPPAATADPETAIAKPKFGDTATSGYFRGGIGGSSQNGRQVCFQLANVVSSKYRLGNECEVWGEFQLTTVVYAGSDGSVAHIHFMPTAFIPNPRIGYPPTGTTSSDLGSPGTGATVAFPNLYVDIQGIPWLGGGTAWAGTRYYKRESIYISDFFYWNPSGVGAGIEDIGVGHLIAPDVDAIKDLKFSYGAFAVDGEPSGVPQLPQQTDLGLRNDFQIRGLKPYPSGELQVGFQYIHDLSSPTNGVGSASAGTPNPTFGGWGVTFQYVQQLLGGDNKLAFQYGRGGGTGFGTLGRFYYPDFSLKHDPSIESRTRVVDVLTVQPVEWLGGQAAFVYQHDDQGGTQKQNWISAGARVAWAFTEHAKLLGEAGYDHVKKANGSVPQMLAKFTIAPALTTGRSFSSRPEIRVFYTWAMWNESARTATVDSVHLYTDTLRLSGSTFGLQGETWW